MTQMFHVGLAVVTMAFVVIRFALTPRHDRKTRTLRLAEISLVVSAASLFFSGMTWPSMPQRLRTVLVVLSVLAFVLTLGVVVVALRMRDDAQHR